MLALLLFVTANLSIRPSSCNNSALNGKIFLKLVYFSKAYREESVSIQI
jgi:hypothetical protein